MLLPPTRTPGEGGVCLSPPSGPLLSRLWVCSEKKVWNLGMSNSKLSYYDGMIQLSYKDGTPYGDGRPMPRTTLITFLCDREVGVGVPEYQVGRQEDRREGARGGGALCV